MRNREVGTKHVFAGGTRLVSKLVKAPNVVDLDGDGIPDDMPNACSEPWGWTNGNGGQGNANGICNGNGGGNGNGNGGSGPEVFEKDQYYYHPDHLGSSSYVTDLDGEIFQHLEYFPFGETWVEEHSNTQRTPYLFTSKELDEETGLYYFGARYYDTRTSVWQSPDPILDSYMQGNGSREGVYTPRNLNLYAYSHQRPVIMFDPDGLQTNYYTGLNGVSVHNLFFAQTRTRLPGNDYHFDVSPRRSLGIASALEPDVIQQLTYNSGLIWELKPIGHNTSPAGMAEDALQVGTYITVAANAGFTLVPGPPDALVPDEGAILGVINDAATGDELLVRLWTHNTRNGRQIPGMVYYSLHRIHPISTKVPADAREGDVMRRPENLVEMWQLGVCVMIGGCSPGGLPVETPEVPVTE